MTENGDKFRYCIVGSVVLLAAVWGALEFSVVDRVTKTSIRLAYVVTLFSVPIVYRVYRWGFSENIPRTMKAVFVNFALKAFILITAPLVLWQFIRFDLLFFEILLFFMIFSLSFLAIYLARIHENSMKGG